MWTVDLNQVVTAEAKATEAAKAAREAVNAERARRIIEGTALALPGGVTVFATGRDEDFRNLTNLAMAAQLRIAGNDTTTPTVFRDGNNDDHSLTPPQVLALWQAASAHVSAIYAASWAIKAMDPMPDDVTDDVHWP